MKRTFLTRITGFSLIATALAGCVWANIYVVKRGDQLSSIAGKYIPGPVWGEKGSLSQVLKMNPQFAKNPDLIYPNQTIVLPDGSSNEIKLSEINPPGSRAPAEADTEEWPKPAPAQIEITPTYLFSTLHLQDKATAVTASLATQVSANIGLRYFQNWTDSARSFERFSLGVLSIEPPQTDSSSVVSSTKIMSTIGAGGSFQLSERINLEFSVNYESELFTRGITTQSVTVDSVMVPDFAMKVSYDIYQGHPFSLGLSAEGIGLLPASEDSYRVNAGYAVGGDLYLKQKFQSGKEFLIDVGFQSRVQNTSLVTQTENELLFGIHFSLPCGN